MNNCSATSEAFGVVTACDQKYFFGVVALMKSIKVNSPLPVTVINQGMEGDQIEYLKSLGANVIDVTRSININDDRFGCCYVLFDIDNAPYDRLLYLDADMLVLGDLTHLDSKIREHKFLWTLSNPSKLIKKRKYKARIKHALNRIQDKDAFYKHYKSDYSFIKGYLRKQKSCLNSGILGIDKSLMEEMKNGIDKYKPFLDKFIYPDQDLLSLLKVDYSIKGYQLGYEYNACRLHGHPKYSCEAKIFKGIGDLLDLRFYENKLYIKSNKCKKGLVVDNLKIKVLHYNNSEKPWNSGVKLKAGFKEIWDYYYNL